MENNDMIDELIKELESWWEVYVGCNSNLADVLEKAANTIESLSQTEKQETDRDIQVDKVMCVNMYLLEKYGDELWKEFGLEKTGDTMKDMFSAMAIVDEIYKRQKEKYPHMWYEYCCSLK